MKSIFSFRTFGKWTKGEFAIRYNVTTLTKWAVALLLLYWTYLIVKGLIWGGKKAIDGLVWCWDNWQWTLPCLLFVLLIYGIWRSGWLKNLFKRRPKVEEITESPMPSGNKRKWLWLLLLIPLGLLLWLLFKPAPQPAVIEERTAKAEQEQIYDQAFDDVVIARAYLDGVQTSGSRVLVGLKYIQGLSVKGMNFDDKTYDEAKKIVAEEWKPLVLDNLNPEVKLTKQQMSAAVLTAMRMGPNGFPRSTFCKEVNAGNLDEATDWLLLQNSDGSIRKTGTEPRQYFYVLRLLWSGEIAISDLSDYPMFSYRDIPDRLMYDNDGRHIFNQNIANRLKRGQNQTPLQALGLED